MLGVEPEVVRGGRGARRVTQNRGDDRRRRVGLEHRDRQRAAQRVQAVRPPGREHNPGTPRVITQPAARRRRGPERGERIAVFDEHLSAGRLRPAVADVVDHRPSDVGRQRQRQRHTGLVLRQCQRLGPPIEPTELQTAQVSDPQTEPGGQENHRVVAFSDRGLPVDLAPTPGGSPQPSTGAEPTGRVGDSAAAGAARQDPPGSARLRADNAGSPPTPSAAIRSFSGRSPSAGAEPKIRPGPGPAPAPGCPDRLLRDRRGNGPRRAA